MAKIIIAIIITTIVIILGLSWYLQPNDLIGCDKVPSKKTGCQSVDAIIAISGGDTDARAGWAIDLYKAGWSDKLIFSGAASDKSGPSNAAVMKRLAIESGIPAKNVYVEEDSATTGENAKNSQKVFEKYGIKKVILVTSAYHQRRASLEFKKRTANALILNGPVLIDKDWSFWWWTSLRGWWLAMGEFVKIVIFFAAGI